MRCDYFLNFFLLFAASPIKPEPNRSIVTGSGTGAAETCAPRHVGRENMRQADDAFLRQPSGVRVLGKAAEILAATPSSSVLVLFPIKSIIASNSLHAQGEFVAGDLLTTPDNLEIFCVIC